MSVIKRHDEILRLVRESGAIEVDDLAAAFGVTTQTIRQDLRHLDTQGFLKRTHGGARKLDTVTTRDYAERRKHRGAQKRDIGDAAAALIPNGSSVMLNIGTTTEQVAHALRGHSELMVISNNINIITQLSGTTEKDLVLVGGRVRQSDGAVVGEDAVEFISRYKVDYAVIGCSSLDETGQSSGRGIRVGLAEMGDLGAATSSASTKLFHGGLRYLEYLEFRLVREALIEREILLRAMPHISWPMRFVLPYTPDMRFESGTPVSRMVAAFMPWLKGRRPAWLIRLGLFLYDHLGGRDILPGTKSLDLHRDPAGTR